MEQNPRELIQRGIDALNSGDKATARQFFSRVTTLVPHYQAGWLWLSDATDNDTERRQYLERCLQQDPHSRSGQIARKKLDQLNQAALYRQEPFVPQPMLPPGENIVPSMPPDFTEAPAPSRRSSAIWMGTAAVVMAVLLVWSISLILTDAVESDSTQGMPGAPVPIVTPTSAPSYPVENQPVPDAYPTVGLDNSVENTAPPDAYTAPQPRPEPQPDQPPQDVSPTAELVDPFENTTPQDTYTGTQPRPEPQPDQPPPDAYPTAQGADPVERTPEQQLSQGIGANRLDWEMREGIPDDQTGESTFVYGGGMYEVWFEGSTIQALEHRITDAPVPLETARQLSKRFLPQDSVQIETREAPDSALVDVYESAWLSSELNSGAGSEATPLYITYDQAEGGVTGYKISTTEAS